MPARDTDGHLTASRRLGLEADARLEVHVAVEPRERLRWGHEAGASASVKGYAKSPAFAMGKMGLTGLVQSMARELQPQNIHVAQVVIDGGISNPDRPERLTERGPDGCLEPDAIAQTYLHLHRQHRSAWASHIELRPWSEKF